MASFRTNFLFLEVLFQKLYFGDSKLRKLNIADSSRMLPKIPTVYFVEVVKNLESVNLEGCVKNGSPNIQELFLKLRHKNTKLRRLNLSMCNFTDIPADLAAEALNSLEEVELDWSEMTKLQTEALFSKMSKTTNLKKLSFTTDDLSTVNPTVFSQAINNLEDVSLSMVENSSIQIQEFFNQMSKKTNLRKLRIESINISDTNPKVLSQSVSNLEHLILSQTHLTTDQLSALLPALTCKTKCLILSGNDLSQVQPEIIGKSLAKIKSTNLSNCHVTKEQLEVLYEELSTFEGNCSKGLHFGLVSREQADVLREIKELKSSRFRIVVTFMRKYWNSYTDAVTGPVPL